MDELLTAINKYPNGTKLVINWKNGMEIKGEIDTIYETNNGLEIDEEGYQEYYACAFNVLDILHSSEEKLYLEIGGLIEVSMQDPPMRLMLEDGTPVWEKCD